LPTASVRGSIRRMLNPWPVLLAGLLARASFLPAGEVLIVADEFPAMEALAGRLKSGEGISSRIVKQTDLPADLAKFPAVIVYLHRALNASRRRR